jgi:hypothetical protein
MSEGDIIVGRVIVIVVLIAILASLGSALVAMLDPGYPCRR